MSDPITLVSRDGGTSYCITSFTAEPGVKLFMMGTGSSAFTVGVYFVPADAIALGERLIAAAREAVEAGP